MIHVSTPHYVIAYLAIAGCVTGGIVVGIALDRFVLSRRAAADTSETSPRSKQRARKQREDSGGQPTSMKQTGATLRFLERQLEDGRNNDHRKNDDENNHDTSRNGDDSARDAKEEQHAQVTAHNAQRPRFTLLIHHIAKQINIGNLVRIATAFDCAEIVCVGARKQNSLSFFGSHGSACHVPIKCCANLAEAVAYLKRPVEQGGGGPCEIVGIEIGENARDVSDADAVFAHLLHRENEEGSSCRRRVCFVPGNEGIGLTDQQKSYCDYFVYIPQFGVGTASLNVCSAVAIVVHRFCCAVGYKCRPIQGEKYDVVALGVAQRAKNRPQFVPSTVTEEVGADDDEEGEEKKKQKTRTVVVTHDELVRRERAERRRNNDDDALCGENDY